MISCDPKDLIKASACFKCIPPGMQQEVITYLLCQIAQSGGGGSCSSQSGSGSPVGVATPAFIGQLYIDTTGPHYWRSTGLTSADWTAIGGGSPTQLVIEAQLVQYIAFAFDNLTTDISLPNATGAINSIYVTGFPVLKTFSAPLLTSCTGIIEFDDDGSSNLLLNTISLPNMGMVAGNIVCSQAPSLSTIDWSNWVQSDNTQVKFKNDALNAASVELILRRLVLAGVTTCTIDLSGGTNAGLASLSAQGQTDAATLGAQLTINP